MKENLLKEKSFQFAIRIVNLCKYLKKENQKYILSKQVIRSGTSIGAIVRESEHAESLKDFIHKLSIVLKEANECKYWLDLLVCTGFISNEMFASLSKDCEELLTLLTARVKTSKLRIK